MARPTHTDLIDAAADILETTATAGIVVRDPLYAGQDVGEYARMVMNSSGVADGWLIVAGPEQPEERGPADGSSGFGILLMTAIVAVNPDRTPTSSLTHFGQKVADAKIAFRLNTAENLGLAGADFQVRQYLPYAPDGYFRDQTDSGPMHNVTMHLKYWVKDC